MSMFAKMFGTYTQAEMDEAFDAGHAEGYKLGFEEGHDEGYACHDNDAAYDAAQEPGYPAQAEGEELEELRRKLAALRAKVCCAVHYFEQAAGGSLHQLSALWDGDPFCETDEDEPQEPDHNNNKIEGLIGGLQLAQTRYDTLRSVLLWIDGS